jgi:hypothetical protein
MLKGPHVVHSARPDFSLNETKDLLFLLVEKKFRGFLAQMPRTSLRTLTKAYSSAIT